MLGCSWLCDGWAGQHVLWRADRTTVGWPYLYRWFRLRRTSLNCQLLQREQGGFDHFAQCSLEGSPLHGLFKSTLPWSQSLLVFETIDSCFITTRGTIQFCHLLTLTKWELTKWELPKWEVDQMGIDKVGIDDREVRINRVWQSEGCRICHDSDPAGDHLCEKSGIDVPLVMYLHSYCIDREKLTVKIIL